MNVVEQQEQDEISLLDLLLVVAENIKLLVFGPIVAGLLALAIAFALPQKFVSQAILAFPSTASASASASASVAQTAAMLVSPLVLDPVIDAHGLAKGRSTQVARNELVDQVKAVVGKDGLLRLDVTANAAKEAQALSNAIIDSWRKSTVPSEQESKDLERRLSVAQNGLKTVTALLERLALDGGTSLARPLTRGEGGTGLVAVGELQYRYLTDVLTIPRILEGASRDVVRQPPTLPTEAVSPKKGLVAIVTGFGVGFLLLFWVFVRQAWKSAVRDSEDSEKVGKLRTALGFKSGSI